MTAPCQRDAGRSKEDGDHVGSNAELHPRAESMERFLRHARKKSGHINYADVLPIDAGYAIEQAQPMGKRMDDCSWRYCAGKTRSSYLDFGEPVKESKPKDKYLGLSLNSKMRFFFQIKISADKPVAKSS